ncbi:hypothetical protein CPB83DRAFT_937285, partial [Crepidotus variabilis]
LQRTGVLGGGGKSIASVAKKLFNQYFSALTKKGHHEKVLNEQRRGWKWTNDHQNSRVFSTNCHKDVPSRSPGPPKPCSMCLFLPKNCAFQNAIQKKPPTDKTYVHVNHRFSNQEIGEIYTRSVGVKELIEEEVSLARSSVYVRYAKGALNGNYDNEVFNSLFGAMVTKHDKEK